MSYKVDHGSDLLRQGKRAIGQARYLALIDEQRSEAEAKAREALSVLASAGNWLDGTSRFDEAHEVMDAAGRYVARTFGCHLGRTGSTYVQACPVAIAHKRVGLSPAMEVQESSCSLCNAPYEDCDHIAGKEYDSGICIRQIEKFVVIEVSIVAQPAQPDARMTEIPISTQDLQARLPNAWRPGMDVKCDRCLDDCDGVDRPFDSPELTVRRTRRKLPPDLQAG